MAAATNLTMMHLEDGLVTLPEDFEVMEDAKVDDATVEDSRRDEEMTGTVKMVEMTTNNAVSEEVEDVGDTDVDPNLEMMQTANAEGSSGPCHSSSCKSRSSTVAIGRSIATGVSNSIRTSPRMIHSWCSCW